MERRKETWSVSKLIDDGTTTTYEGQWNRDHVDGAGTIRDTFDMDPNEYRIFEGHFKMGLRNGQGTETVVSAGITEKENRYT